jgi:ABC-2 type transport system ATP-binding protein
VSPPNGGAVSAISASGIRKTFVVRGWLPNRPTATVEALRGIDLEVAPGTIHGVIGPNGSGKSTMLRILATLVAADGGTATVSGADVDTQGVDVRRSIGFTTGDERSLYWRLTARQNLEFAAALHHVPDTGAAIADALVAANLAHAADRPVSGFSQGMLRRLGLARALLHRPAVLLLDEPSRSLDPVARDELHGALSDLRGTGGVTTLLTTHDLAEAAAVCERVSVIREGRIVADLAGATERALEKALRKKLS